jgi:pimeloyl-ACP methyl ester carboxylesterase
VQLRAVALALLLLLPALAGCVGPARACADAGPRPGAGSALEPVEFATGDGVALRGDFQAGDPGHAVVLVHGLNEDRHSWKPLENLLNETGFTWLAFDLRGHGQSRVRAGAPYELANFTAQDFAAMEQDVAAAIEVVRSRSAPACLALVGASVGANLALRVGSADPGVDAAVLLSPGKDYRGLTTLDALPGWGPRPLWLGAARGDAPALEGAQAIAAAAPADTLALVDGSAHGTNLLADRSMAAAIAGWLATRA